MRRINTRKVTKLDYQGRALFFAKLHICNIASRHHGNERWGPITITAYIRNNSSLTPIFFADLTLDLTHIIPTPGRNVEGGWRLTYYHRLAVTNSTPERKYPQS
jgi:hypothetical protein